VRALTLGGLAAVAGYVGYQAVHPRAQRWGRGFARGPEDENAVYLTFDDGPSDETERLLDVLGEHGVKATFFLCGLNVERRPETARRALAEGHAIGNHTHAHPALLRLGPAQVREEVTRAQRTIEDRLGASPRLFRPPYGLRSPWLQEALDEHGLTLVHWTAIGNDWKLAVEGILRRIRPALRAPGTIVCLHDGDGVSVEVDRAETTRAVARLLGEPRETEFRALGA